MSLSTSRATETQAGRPGPRRRRSAARARRRAARRRLVMWALGAVVTAVVVAGLLASGQSTTVVQGAAPAFDLATTDGSRVSLAGLAGKPALLYFNEGVGCDACFFQMARIEAEREAFDRAGIRLVPVVMNSAEDVRSELRRFGITTPYALDRGGAASRAYGTLGGGHHADLPGHSFVLIGPDGTRRWQGDYPTMWVEPSELLAVVTAAL